MRLAGGGLGLCCRLFTTWRQDSKSEDRGHRPQRIPGYNRTRPVKHLSMRPRRRDSQTPGP